MTQPVLFLHLQDPELTSQLLQSDIVRRFVICKSQSDECWVEQLLRQTCDLAFIEIDSTEPAQYELLQQSNRLAEIDFILVSKDQKANAQANAASYANGNKMVVLIDEEKIERMAARYIFLFTFCE